MGHAACTCGMVYAAARFSQKLEIAMSRVVTINRIHGDLFG